MQCVVLLALISLATLGSCKDALGSVSVLGLQRSVKVDRAAAAPISEEEGLDMASPIPLRSGSILGLQRSMALSRTQVPLVEDEDADTLSTASARDEMQNSPSFRSASLLGLQRSMTLSRTNGPVEEEDPSANMDGGTSATAPKSSAASILGFQRSMKLSRGPSPSEDEDSPTSASLQPPAHVKAGGVLPLEEDDLTYEDVSVLALQRSVKIVRRQVVQEDPAHAEDQAAFSVFEV